MGKLDSSRMSNATKLNKVDDAHVALEGDLEEIFGIPDNTDIDPAIWSRVNPDGTIEGVQRFYMAAASSTAEECIGLEFDDGTKKKRIVFKDSGFFIFEWNTTDETWDLVTDMEVPGSGKLTGLSDVDIEESELTTSVGYLVQVKDDDEFDLVEAASSSGVTTFAELSDTPAAYNGTSFDPADSGSFLAVKSDGSALEVVSAPLGLGDPYVVWATTALPRHWRSGTWEILYGWADSTGFDDGGLLTAGDYDNDGSKANKFITLPIGIYDVSLWMSTEQPVLYGLREWKINTAASTAVGPGTYGSNDRANVAILNQEPQLKAMPGIHSLGTRQIIQLSASQLWFEVNQDSGEDFLDVDFFISISRVK